MNVEHSTSNVQHRIRLNIGLNKMRLQSPATMPERVSIVSLYDILSVKKDRVAQQHPYSMFNVGRSMFDVQSFPCSMFDFQSFLRLESH
jgi:hypothetical protein